MVQYLHFRILKFPLKDTKEVSGPGTKFGFFSTNFRSSASVWHSLPELLFWGCLKASVCVIKLYSYIGKVLGGAAGVE